ncbi:MAG: CvpA family protein [Defluviitaleaceae bacterium]|nr:CvpA family protein [Defluviitaleaceae bacterium]MCL2262713.1 CvpA family protein [Defluviitaleaceae bacterium]
MNILDICVLILVALCAIAGFRQGLIRTVYRLVSFFIAIFLANLLFPYVARLLRETVIFSAIQDSVKSALNLGGFVTEYSAAMQTEIIESLRVPVPIRGLLHSHFEPDIHGILRIDTIEDYISAFFANIAVNALAIFLVFILVLIILSVIGMVLDIVGKLPVISTFNNVGGLIVGAVMGALISWLCIIVLSMFFATSANAEIYVLIQDSLIVSWATDLVLPRLAVAYDV